MRIEQLIAFDKVVQHSSFTKAANELYTTQPSVSKMIDALEDELGHQLLRRTSRGIELTAYGKWVYGDVKIILQMVNGWQESTPLEEVPREVHIQSTTTMCNFLSAGFIPCLKDRHPDVNLLLHECRRSEIIHKMEENGVHIGLLPIRKENQADSTATLERIRKNGWDCCEVIEDPEYLFLGSGHPLALTGEITPQMLAQVPLGTYSHVNDDNWLLFGHYFSGEAGFRCHSKDAILQYVAQNRCAAIFPRFTSQYEYFVSQGAVQPVMVHGLDFGHATFLLVHQSGKSLLREEQSVVCALKRYFKDCTCK